MTDSPRGLPLLSGPPPEAPLDERADVSCRKCNKEFNVLFARGRRCNHCGYSYCYSCSDYQALMPRRIGDAGYDCMAVCAFCIQYLQITAGGRGYLRSLPLARLKNYMQAYGLKVGADVLEKDDIINAIIAARASNGCLPRSNENYYRKYSVPSGQSSRPRGFFSRLERTEPRQYLNPRAGWTRSTNFARPDLQPDLPTGADVEARPQQNAQQEHNRQQEQHSQSVRNQYAPPPGPPPNATFNSARYGTHPNSHSPHSQAYPQYLYPQYRYPGNTPSPLPSNPNISSPSSNRTQSVPPNRPATVPPPRHSPPRPHVPTLDELLQIPEEEIPLLTVGVLKEILENNHVRPGLVLEKSELVARVNALITAERRERVRAAAVREREEWEAQERLWAAREQERAAQMSREQAAGEGAGDGERRRRREAYRTTVESASESDDSSQDHSPHSQPQSETSLAKEGTQKRDEAKVVDLSRSPSPTPSRTVAERSGLCVVCQDEEANIVVIDCGHLALCRACSDLVWSSTRECPLCRTRIVTQARLLRVFKA